MEPEKLSRPWRTLGIRLSVFPVGPWEAPADLWRDIVGELPANEANQPREHVRVQSGPWQGGTLQLTASQLLTVWFGLPPPTPEGRPQVENWAVVDILPAFHSITRAWLASADFGIKRIGFGLNALLSAQDQVSAYRLLNGIVSAVEIDPEATSDFTYQINRPAPSQTLGGSVRLNRLMKWSAPFFRGAQIQVAPGGTIETTSLAGEQYAGMEIDTNTPAEWTDPLDKERLGAIYDELVKLAWQSLEFGELGVRL